MALSGHSRPRLEHPLRHLAALGTAALLCAGVVAAVLALQSGVTPGGNGSGAASAGSETASAAETNAVTPAPSPFSAPYGDFGKAQYEKLEDFVQITEKDGKYYADEILNLVVAHQSEYGLDVAWCDKAVRGELSKEEILAEFAKADERAAKNAPNIQRVALLDGIISIDQAIATAREVYLEYLGLDTTGCAIADRSSYSQSVMYGTDELFDPMYCLNQFAGRKLLVVTFFSAEDINKALNVKHPGWQFELVMDGKAAAHFPSAVVVIDAATGDVLYKSKDALQTPQPTPADSPVPSNGLTPNPSPWPTPSDINLGTKKTLPDGVISPDQAIAIAKNAFKDNFGIDVGDCVIVDSFTYDKQVIYGTTELFRPHYKNNEYAGKKIMMLSIQGDVWHIGLGSDGTYGKFYGATATLIINAKTGEIEDAIAATPGP